MALYCKLYRSLNENKNSEHQKKQVFNKQIEFKSSFKLRHIKLFPDVYENHFASTKQFHSPTTESVFGTPNIYMVNSLTSEVMAQGRTDS